MQVMFIYFALTERRSLALHNIESLLCSVDEAQNSGVVLDAYKIGSNTLKKVLSDSGLKYDNVDEVLADVRDTLDQHREVQDVLSTSVVEGASQEEDQLERELRELCGESSQSTFGPLINNNEKPEVVITDEEMIAMLQDLEVEDDPKNIFIYDFQIKSNITVFLNFVSKLRT